MPNKWRAIQMLDLVGLTRCWRAVGSQRRRWCSQVCGHQERLDQGLRLWADFPFAFQTCQASLDLDVGSFWLPCPPIFIFLTLFLLLPFDNQTVKIQPPLPCAFFFFFSCSTCLIAVCSVLESNTTSQEVCLYFFFFYHLFIVFIKLNYSCFTVLC